MVASKSDYRYLAINVMRTSSGEMYQARLSSKLGRKTIGLGSEKLTALNLAMLLDEEITKLIAKEEPIDLDHLKSLVKSEQKKIKVKKTGNIRLVEKDDLQVLWTKYVNFHVALKTWKETTILTAIATVTSLLAKCPYQKLEQKNELVQWLFSDAGRSPKTSKHRLKFIVAAIDWNSKTGNIPRNWGIEYRDLLQSIDIKTEKNSGISCADDASNIEIFSVKEVYQILEALKEDTYSRFPGKHKQYYKYCYFLWLTGARLSEAVALKWDNVDLSKKRIIFCETQVNASGRIIAKSGTKTVETRYFPINGELHDLLISIPDKKGFVFKNCVGKAISQKALNGIWNTLIKAMGIKHRVPYQLRHTMISYHANNDYPIHKLAEIVGNSEKIIKEFYLKLDIERISLPDVIKP